MEKKEQNPKVKFLINIAYWAAILAIIFLIIKYLLNKLMPIFLAFVFAAVCRPISDWLSRDYRYKRNEAGERIRVKRKVHLHKNVAGILSVVVLFLAVGSLLALLIIRAADRITDLIATMPSIYEKDVVPAFNKLYERIVLFTNHFDSETVDAIEAALPNVISSLGSAVTRISGILVGWLTGLASNLPSIFLNTVICLIATVFFAIDFDSIRTFFSNNLPAKTVRMVGKIKDSFLGMIWEFLKSYFIIFCITVTELSIGLLIVGVDHPIGIATLIGIFDAFPIVGSGMIMLPWSIITLLSGETIRGLGLFVVYAVVVIVRQVIEPKIVGKHVGLRPIVTLTCMYAGTRIFGGIGLFALPIAVSIVADLNDNGIIHLFRRNDSAEPEQAPIEETSPAEARPEPKPEPEEDGHDD